MLLLSLGEGFLKGVLVRASRASRRRRSSRGGIGRGSGRGGSGGHCADKRKQSEGKFAQKEGKQAKGKAVTQSPSRRLKAETGEGGGGRIGKKSAVC